MPLLRYLPWFRNAAQALPRLEAREQWSRTEIETYQLERVNATWQVARRWVPYYRQLVSEHSLPPTWRSLEEYQNQMPVLSRVRMQSCSRQVLSDRAEGGHWSRTGGSTGEPLNIFWSNEAHAENMFARYRFLQLWGIDPLDPTVYLWGHAASFLPGWSGWFSRLRQPWVDWLRGRLRLSAYRLGTEDLREHLQRMISYRPRVFYAYSTAAALLAQQAQALGIRCDSLKVAILTAEPVLPHLVRTVEEGLGVPALNEYGSIDCGLLANEFPDRTLRVREDRLLMETLPREDGRYDIAVTLLGNPDYPLMRYALGDTTDQPLQKPEKGFAILSNVGGRVNDLLLTRTGRVVHSTAVDVLLELRGGEGLRRYTCRQRADGSLQVVIDNGAGIEDICLEGIRTRLEELLEGYPVEVKVSDSLPGTAAGKHRWICSDLYARQVAENV